LDALTRLVRFEAFSCYNILMYRTDRSNSAGRTPEQIHVKQRFWQILFPVLVVCVLLSVGFALLLLYSAELGSSTEGMAAAALVAIALPLLLIFLVLLLFLTALIIGAFKAAAWLPEAGGEALRVFRSINSAAQRGTRALVAPLLTIGQRSAEIQHVIATIRSRLTKGKER